MNSSQAETQGSMGLSCWDQGSAWLQLSCQPSEETELHPGAVSSAALMLGVLLAGCPMGSEAVRSQSGKQRPRERTVPVPQLQVRGSAVRGSIRHG